MDENNPNQPVNDPLDQPAQQQQNQNQQQIPLNINVQQPPTPIVKKSLSKWGMRGLDLTDSGFSKLHDKESKFDLSKETQYNLEPEKFENYKQTLIQKVNRIHALNCMSARDDNGNTYEILKEYTRLTRENIKTAALERWPYADPIFNTVKKLIAIAMKYGNLPEKFNLKDGAAQSSRSGSPLRPGKSSQKFQNKYLFKYKAKEYKNIY